MAVCSKTPILADLSEVRGQEMALRAVEVAAAGGHSLLLVGPPGCGKTLLARCLPGLLPPLSPLEAAELAEVRALAGAPAAGEGARRPFRRPSPSLAPAGMAGGGRPFRPGEASLAHGGVLFLDELTDFRREALAALLRPLDEGLLEAPGSGGDRLPARFQLVAAANGFLRGRLAAALLDRIHLKIELAPVSARELRRIPAPGSSTAEVARRVAFAREIQAQRFAPDAAAPVNAWLRDEEVPRHCRLDAAGRSLLETAVARLSLSARGVASTLKVARTVADLAGSCHIRAAHLAEALQYRGGSGRA